QAYEGYGHLYRCASGDPSKGARLECIRWGGRHEPAVPPHHPTGLSSDPCARCVICLLPHTTGKLPEVYPWYLPLKIQILRAWSLKSCCVVLSRSLPPVPTFTINRLRG